MPESGEVPSPRDTAPDALPSWEGFLVPVLAVLANGEVRRARWVRQAVMDFLALSEEQRAEMLPSGNQGRADNRAGWAVSFLARVQAVARPARGQYRISDAGRALLAAHPQGITERDLKALPAWAAYVPQERTSDAEAASPTVPAVVEAEQASPQETIEEAVQRAHDIVADELLARLREEPPEFLESAAVHVMQAMGYGGGVTNPGSVTRRTGDAGIDGIIKQDALGLDTIYLQAKRYTADHTVQRPELQGFVGALHGQSATRGVFITTSTFTPGAKEYAASIGLHLVLIDGARLADLMIRYGVGVQVRHEYKVVELDEDYFEG